MRAKKHIEPMTKNCNDQKQRRISCLRLCTERWDVSRMAL